MIPTLNQKFYCRLPGGSAFITFLGLVEERINKGLLWFLVVRSDGVKREQFMTEHEWNEFSEDHVVIPLEDEDESSDDIGTGLGEDHSNS
jgi:hypothetical protein